jgi:hypothetical protein
LAIGVGYRWRLQDRSVVGNGEATRAREGVSGRSVSVSHCIFRFNLDGICEIGNCPVVLTLCLQGITAQYIRIVIFRIDRNRLADVGNGVIAITLGFEAPRSRDI